MNQSTTSLPKWILIVSALLALMELMVSAMMVLMPEEVVHTADLAAPGVLYLVYMWAARQFALGVIFAVATLKRSVPMLTITYLFFLVMFLGDLAIGVHQGESSLVISAIMMCLLSSVMLWALQKQPTKS